MPHQIAAQRLSSTLPSFFLYGPMDVGACKGSIENPSAKSIATQSLESLAVDLCMIVVSDSWSNRVDLFKYDL